MSLRLYNSLTRKKEEFRPLRPGQVMMYDCGPTVYFYAHIGNLWRYLISDLLRRTLEYDGYQVKQVMNITDVGHLTDDDLLAADTGEDKIVQAAKKEKKTPRQVADFYTKAFFRDRERLNMLQPQVVPKATEHIQEMIGIIKILEKKGYAYWAGDKYFVYDISKFKNYGRLSGKKIAELKSGARLEPIKEKRHPFDFALWIKDPNHLMKWESPWGAGYPGWHIECSAMSMKYLGPTLDIHTGGEDNIFPHHENEIAQSEAATGQQFVRYWLHVRHSLVNGRKMSKSKSNFYLLQDLIDKGFDPLAFRYLCLQTHYRKGLNFTWESLASAQRALNKLRRYVDAVTPPRSPSEHLGGVTTRGANIKPLRGRIKTNIEPALARLNDDLDTPGALAWMWQKIKDQSLSYDMIKLLDQVLGLGLAESGITNYELRITNELKKLLVAREKLRQAGKFQEADQIREKIWKKGYTLTDTSAGPKLKKYESGYF